MLCVLPKYMIMSMSYGYEATEEEEMGCRQILSLIICIFQIVKRRFNEPGVIISLTKNTEITMSKIQFPLTRPIGRYGKITQ